MLLFSNKKKKLQHKIISTLEDDPKSGFALFDSFHIHQIPINVIINTLFKEPNVIKVIPIQFIVKYIPYDDLLKWLDQYPSYYEYIYRIYLSNDKKLFNKLVLNKELFIKAALLLPIQCDYSLINLNEQDWRQLINHNINIIKNMPVYLQKYKDVKEIVFSHPGLIKYCNSKLFNQELANHILKHNIEYINYIPNKFIPIDIIYSKIDFLKYGTKDQQKNIPENVVKKLFFTHNISKAQANMFNYIPEKYLSLEIIKKYLDVDPSIFNSLNDKYIDQNMCNNIFMYNTNCFKYIPDKYKTQTMINIALYDNLINFKYINDDMYNQRIFNNIFFHSFKDFDSTCEISPLNIFKDMPDKYRTPEIIKSIYKQYGLKFVYKHVSFEEISQDDLIQLIKRNPDDIIYIPLKFLNSEIITQNICYKINDVCYSNSYNHNENYFCWLSSSLNVLSQA